MEAMPLEADPKSADRQDRIGPLAETHMHRPKLCGKSACDLSAEQISSEGAPLQDVCVHDPAMLGPCILAQVRDAGARFGERAGNHEFVRHR